ncbi:MAG: GLPGLI family protein [Spirosomaceae bacterium]|nr:GLPGLI family protein [Spirosomataceae bacterium]
MKTNTITWLLALCTLFNAFGQTNTEGKIIFEHKINMHKRLTDESMKAMIPEFRTSQMQLNFRGGESLYIPVPKDEDDSETNSTDANGNQMRIVVRTPQSEVYRNYDNQEKIELKELAGQKFLVMDTLKKTNWKITGEMKKIHGHDCMQATMTNPANKQVTQVWFTEAIPAPHGPMVFGGLPGMILEANVNDGEMIYTAQTIDFKKLGKDDFRKPSGGKKVTEAQFNKERDAWMKEMGVQPGGGPGIRVIRN